MIKLNENEDEQGVLISARLLSKRRITVYVVDGKGSLQVRKNGRRTEKDEGELGIIPDR